MIAGGNATVMVADMDRAVAFYTRVLGLELSPDPGPTGPR
jgi:catechol 2,3-dioxygenase-like lactoylglutathione lyase family enzyme